jgi:formylmethanofuran dehydrogenase subunit E
MKKVFVLVTDSIYPSASTEIRVRVFSDRATAERVVETEYNAELTDWKLTFDDDDMFEVETCDGSRSIWESGAYETNHISWKIEECEVK